MKTFAAILVVLVVTAVELHGTERRQEQSRDAGPSGRLYDLRLSGANHSHQLQGWRLLCRKCFEDASGLA
jgi:hypothetical protein